MDFNTTIDIIIKDLRETAEIIEDLKNHPGAPLFQIELAKSKLKSTAEIISFLKDLKSDNKIISGEKVADPSQKVVGTEETTENLIEIGEETEEEETAIKQSEYTIIADHKQVETTKKDTTIIADRFSGIQNTLHESFGKINENEDISSVLKSRPVQNLTDAIGINDKFLFIREVFDGNSSNYDQAVAKLNNVASLEDAKAVIMSYTGKAEENEAYNHLMSLVKRKLASDG